MNERIKELANHAGFDFGRDWQVIGQSEDSLKVFAELIVKECMDVANSKAEGIDLGSKLYLYTEDIEDTIKKHFGVEE